MKFPVEMSTTEFQQSLAFLEPLLNGDCPVSCGLSVFVTGSLVPILPSPPKSFNLIIFFLMLD